MSSTSGSDPSPISIPTSQGWDSDGAGSWSTFIVDIGTPPQPARVVISTAGYESWAVVAAGCPAKYPSGCAQNRGGLFNPDNSTSWKNIGLATLALEESLGYVGAGQYGNDVVTLGYPGGGGPTLPNMIVAGLATPDYWLGQFGLDPAPSNFSTLNNPQPNFLWTLNDTRAIPSTSWGYTAGATYQNNKQQGSLTLGGYDASRFSSSKNVTFPLYADVQRRYIVDLLSVTYLPTGVSTIITPTTLMSQKTSMLIDSTVPYIYLPSEMCDKFVAAFGLEYDAEHDIFTVNDTMHETLVDMNPALTFSIANGGGETLDIVLPYAAFDLTATFPVVDNATNYFPLKKAANDTQYVLGRVFLQEAYMIADFERSEFTIAPCVWPATFEQALVPISLRSASTTTPDNNTTTITPIEKPVVPSHGLPIGAIVGIALGGVGLLLGGLILAYFCFWKPRHRKKSEHLTEEAGDSGQPSEQSVDHALHKTELDSKQPAQELLDIREVERRQKFEMAGTPAGQELDSYVPIGSELESPHLYEMPAREPVGSEMSSIASPRMSPHSQHERSPEYFDRNRTQQRTYYNR